MDIISLKTITKHYFLSISTQTKHYFIFDQDHLPYKNIKMQPL
uniref:Uncharacterized protein n=1 Tax=Arundo donax TaxID=35708 RepID=A0A0A9HEZ0_ARUDO